MAAAARADDPVVQRTLGLMTTRLRVASWALDGALTEVGDDPQPSVDRLAAVLAAKREVAAGRHRGVRPGDGPRGRRRVLQGLADRAGLPRHPGAKFHPLSLEATLVHAGRLALGLPVDAYWRTASGG